MVFRRIRGLLTAAALWGVALACTAIVFTSAFFFASSNHGSVRDLVHELADLLPMAFGLGGFAGALFGLLIVLAERGQTLRSVSERRFRVWGGIAGALSIAALEGLARIGHPHTSLIWVFYAILGGGLAGASLAESMLRAARRVDVESTSEQSQIRPPVI
jgi:hypothetical protein